MATVYGSNKCEEIRKDLQFGVITPKIAKRSIERLYDDGHISSNNYASMMALINNTKEVTYR